MEQAGRTHMDGTLPSLRNWQCQPVTGGSQVAAALVLESPCDRDRESGERSLDILIRNY